MMRVTELNLGILILRFYFRGQMYKVVVPKVPVVMNKVLQCNVGVVDFPLKLSHAEIKADTQNAILSFKHNHSINLQWLLTGGS